MLQKCVLFAKVPLLRQIACWLRWMQKCCAGIHVWQRFADVRKDGPARSRLCLRGRTSTLTLKLKAKPLRKLLEDAVVVASGVVILTESPTMFSLGRLLVCSRADVVSRISCAHASRSISSERSHLSLGFHERFLSGFFFFLRHELDTNVDSPVAPISAPQPVSVLPAGECSDLKGMFSLRIISVFWRLCCLFTCLCSEHDKRAAWRRKTTKSSPCCLNFSPQLFKF